jgi:predicted nuclease of predicted toxin-antitoxin system
VRFVHLTLRLVKFLATHVSNVHVNQISNGSSTADSLISQYADQHNYIVVTKDTDFQNSYLIKLTTRKLI